MTKNGIGGGANKAIKHVPQFVRKILRLVLPIIRDASATEVFNPGRKFLRIVLKIPALQHPMCQSAHQSLTIARPMTGKLWRERLDGDRPFLFTPRGHLRINLSQTRWCHKKRPRMSGDHSLVSLNPRGRLLDGIGIKSLPCLRFLLLAILCSLGDRHDIERNHGPANIQCMMNGMLFGRVEHLRINSQTFHNHTQ